MRSFKLISNSELIRCISKEPNDSINKNRKATSLILFFALPISLFLATIYFQIDISKFTEYSLILVSIFTGLLFSFLLTVGEKVKLQKDNPNRDDSQFLNYKRLIKQLSVISQYEIILGVKYVALVMTLSLISRFAVDNFLWVKIFFNGISVLMLTQFIVVLYYVWYKLYFVITDDIDNLL